MTAPILRMRDATFVRGGEVIVPPTTLDVAPGTHVARLCATAREANAVAMMAAGLARCSQGTVLVEEFDPRVQPVHCKRLAAFVPHDPLILAPGSFARYIAYRAALWNIDPVRAHAHATLLLERLGGLHEAFAYPIVAALLPSPALLVLDRPLPAHAEAIRSAARGCAIFSTHVDREAADAYTPAREAQHV